MGKFNGGEARKKTNITETMKKNKLQFSTIINFVFINFTGSWEESVNNLWFGIISKVAENSVQNCAIFLKKKTLKCTKFHRKTQTVDSHSPKCIHRSRTVPIKRIAGFCLQKWIVLNFILKCRHSRNSQVNLNEQIQGFAIVVHPLRRGEGGRILRKASLCNSVLAPTSQRHLQTQRPITFMPPTWMASYRTEDSRQLQCNGKRLHICI